MVHSLVKYISVWCITLISDAPKKRKKTKKEKKKEGKRDD
jgi:hypothetical protein